MQHDTLPSPCLVDGHNVLYALRTRFAEYLLNGHPGRGAREALVDALTAVYRGSGARLRLYFDGTLAHEHQPAPEVTVVYAGRAGSQGADRAILAWLAHSPPAARLGVSVVTRDRTLARRAGKRGASIIDPAEFIALKP